MGALQTRWVGFIDVRSSSVLISNMFSAASISGCRPRIDRQFVTSAADPESCWEINPSTRGCLSIYLFIYIFSECVLSNGGRKKKANPTKILMLFSNVIIDNFSVEGLKSEIVIMSLIKVPFTCFSNVSI